MVRGRRRWHTMVAVSALAALGLVACGGGGNGPAGRPAAPTGNPQAAGPVAPGAQPDPGTSDIPAVTVRDVASGDEFALGSVVPSERPVLVWFWAPH